LRTLSRELEVACELGSAHEWIPDQDLGSVDGLTTRSCAPETIAELVPKAEECVSRLQREPSLPRGAAQEKLKPTVDVPALANGLQGGHIVVAIPFKVGGEVQQRLIEDVLLDEVEDDQEAAEAAVAVQERVDRLELEVGEGAPNEEREIHVLVQKRLEIVERILEEISRRRHEKRVGGVGSADPVLATAKLARRPLLPANPLQQFGMHLPDQPLAQR
jgi:hypothetical protein